MTNPEFSIERRDAVLKSAREIAEKAKADGRELTAAEADQVDTAIAEARKINVMRARPSC